MVDFEQVTEIVYPESYELLKGSWEYRLKLEHLFRNCARNRQNSMGDPEEKAFFSRLVSENSPLLIPEEDVMDQLGSSLIQIIGVSIIYQDQNLLFIEGDSPESRQSEGTGKSNIAYTLLQCEKAAAVALTENISGQLWDWAENNQDLQKTERGDTRQTALVKYLEDQFGTELIDISFDELEGKLLSSNMTSIGCVDGKLSLGLCKGEPLLTAWDMARHLLRVSDYAWVDSTYNVDGDFQGDLIRAMKLYLGNRIKVDLDVFGDLTTPHPIDYIFTVEKTRGKTGSEANVSVERVSTQYAKSELENRLKCNPLYHESGFWEIDGEEHRRRVYDILNEIKGDLPTVYNLKITDGVDADGTIQYNLISEIVRCVKEELIGDEASR